MQDLSVKVLKATQKVRKGQFARRFGTTAQPRLEIAVDGFVASIDKRIRLGKDNKMLIWVRKSFLPDGILAQPSNRHPEDNVGMPSNLPQIEQPQHEDGQVYNDIEVIDLTQDEEDSDVEMVHSCAELIDLTQDSD